MKKILMILGVVMGLGYSFGFAGCQVIVEHKNIYTLELDTKTEYKQFYNRHNKATRIGYCKAGKDLTQKELNIYTKLYIN